MRSAEAGHRLVEVYPRGRSSCFPAGRRTLWRASAVRGGDEPPYDERALVDLIPMLRRVVGRGSRTRTRSRTSSGPAVLPSRSIPARHYASYGAARRGVVRRAERPRTQPAHLLAESARTRWPSCPRPTGTSWWPTRSRRGHQHDGGRAGLPGAVAARLNRARASLRVEYLLAAEGVEPPTDRCRPVLRALSSVTGGASELDANGHLLECTTCAQLADRLFERRGRPAEDGVVRVPVSRDADVVTARQQGREAAARAGFSLSDQTLIATAISEISRNIVKFAERGEVTIWAIPRHAGAWEGSLSVDGRRHGVSCDRGPPRQRRSAGSGGCGRSVTRPQRRVDRRASRGHRRGGLAVGEDDAIATHAQLLAEKRIGFLLLTVGLVLYLSAWSGRAP